MADFSVFEAAVRTQPLSVAAWIRYLDTMRDSGAPRDQLWRLYERAVSALPLSFKIWTRYLHELTLTVKRRPLDVVTDLAADTVFAFDRAVACLPRCPVLWLLYAKFLWQLGMVTRTRRIYDRALQSVPVTQHHLIWQRYSKFASGEPAVNAVIPIKIPPESAVRIFRRYIQIEPQARSLFLQVLRRRKRYSELMALLAEVVSDESFIPDPDTSRLDLWNELCKLLVEHAQDVPHTLSADAILRAGMQRYSAETGSLWVALGHYYIRLGQFEKARDIFEEGFEAVQTIRDFSVIFDSYANFEESMLAMKMESADDRSNETDDDLNIDADDVELRLIRLEHLMNRRPLLVNTVLLKQNPHNVSEWLKRVRIVGENDDVAAVEVFAESTKIIDPKKADGKLSALWIAFAALYEHNKDLESARHVFENAVAVPYRTVDELADVWCAWVEMELRCKQFKRALGLCRRVTASVPEKRERGKSDAHKPVQERVWRSTKLWSLYVDLEESFGTVEDTRAAYMQMIEVKVATPQTILNFAAFLESHRCFEESFRVFEMGLSRFDFPHAMPIWKAYLTKFIERYGGKKLERARELFEQAIAKAPADDARVLFLLYAKLEEDYGLARHALSVYDRALQRVKDDDKIEMFQIYVSKASEMFGVSKTREIYENAIQTLPKHLVRFVIMQYAQLELKLGEIDRVRGLYCYCSQFCNPNTDTQFWETFKEFEVQHGNEDTFREMLRIRRTVAADMAQNHFVQTAVAQAQALASVAQGEKNVQMPANDMQYLEMEASLTAPAAQNPDEVVLMDEEEEEKEEEPDMQIEQKSIPSEVFGSIKPQEKEAAVTSKPMGALARFKNKI